MWRTLIEPSRGVRELAPGKGIENVAPVTLVRLGYIRLSVSDLFRADLTKITTNFEHF